MKKNVRSGIINICIFTIERERTDERERERKRESLLKEFYFAFFRVSLHLTHILTFYKYFYRETLHKSFTAFTKTHKISLGFICSPTSKILYKVKV